jgi:drug/metabolite transporter (DMT)-like permease
LIYFLLFIQQLIASMTHVIGKDALETLTPPLALLLRTTIATLCLLIAVTIKRKKFDLFTGIVRKDLLRLVALGFLNVLTNQFIYFEGLHLTSPADSSLLYAMTPAIVFVFLLFMHGEKTSWKKIAGIVVAFTGTVIVMFEHGATLASDHTKGNILIFIAVIAWSMFTILGKPLIPKYGALRVTAIHFLFGTILFLPVGILSSDLSTIPSISGKIWTEIIYLGAIGSCLNYILWYFALGKLETSKVAIFQNLQPVLTTIIALILGTVFLTPALVGGGVLALTGVLIVEKG